MGGGGSPKVPTAQENANAQMAIEQQRAAIQAQQEQAARDRAAQELAATKATAASKQNAAYQASMGYAAPELANRGIDQKYVDQYNIGGRYNSQVDQAKQAWQDTDVNPLTSNSSWLDNAIQQALGSYRNDLKGKVNNVAGDNFEYTDFGDTADDQVLQSIIDQQYTDASAQANAANARGQLNDVGLTRALSTLDQQKAAGLSQLQSIGGGVLAKDRGQLTSLKNNQFDKIGSTTFTDSYDPSSFDTLLQSTIGNLKNNLSGDIYGAVKGQNFFSPSTAISGAGAVQGYYNPTTATNTAQGNALADGSNPLLAAFKTVEDPNKPKTNAGVNGVF